MRRPLMVRHVVGLGILSVSISVHADTLGDAISQQGGSETLVNAGNAIQGTCRSLVTAAGGGTLPNVGSLSAPRQDLVFRCQEMVQTFVAPQANSYGYSSTGSDGLNAVRQFTGEEASNQRRLGSDANDLQVANVGARMDAIRRGARMMSSGIALNTNEVRHDGAGGSIDPGFAANGGGAGDGGDSDTGWAWFGSFNYGYADRDLSPNESEYDSDIYGGTLGIDYALANGVVIGVATSYLNLTSDFSTSGSENLTSPTNGGNTDGDGYSASGYALFNTGMYFMSAVASYGSADYDLERRAYFLPGPGAAGRPTAPGFVIDRTYRADTESDQISGEVTFGGTILDEGPYSVDAYVKLDYLSMHIDGYTETETDNSDPAATPGLALKYEDQDIDSSQAGIGLTLRRSFNTGFGVVVPYIGGELLHAWGDSEVVKYSYAFALSGSDPSFASVTDDPDSAYGVATVGLSTQFARNLSVFVQYEGLIGLSNTTAGMGTIGIRGTF